MTRMIAISVSGERGCPGVSAGGAACAVGLIITGNKSVSALFIMFHLLHELTAIASPNIKVLRAAVAFGEGGSAGVLCWVVTIYDIAAHSTGSFDIRLILACTRISFSLFVTSQIPRGFS